MTIYYHVPYGPDHISGGIRTAYAHVALLRAAGANAAVWAPMGAVHWLPEAQHLAVTRAQPTAGDVLVLDEMLHPEYAPLMALPCRREMFIQNQYYVLQKKLLDQSVFDLGYHGAFTCSATARRLLAAVYSGMDGIDVVPCCVDPQQFKPLGKGMAIALVPSKLPRHAAWIQHIFRRRHADLRDVPWWSLKGKSQTQMASALGAAGAFLSLSDMESLGLATLEAMACGCAVVGFAGSAADEYTTPANGRWFSPFDLVAVAYALAETLRDIRRQSPTVVAMMQAGLDTAARFSPAATQAALVKHFAGALSA
jgi:hypothetical protein